MLKTFSGSWFEFQHHNPPEGKYWNPVCRAFSEEQWREKVREMKSLDMKYIVLLCTSLVYEDYAEAYFKTDIYPFAENFGCADPIAALMDEASKCGMKVFVSVGYYGPWMHTHENMISRDVEKRAFQSMEELYARFGRYDSFFGWYYPDESGITKYFDPDFIDYINRYSAFGRSLGKDLRILVAPYGTNHLLADDTYAKQLETIDADYIAYQDEVGVHKSQPEDTAAYYEALRKAHDKAGRAALWADMELFDFEGDVYRSALVPANIDRLERQLASVSPYCDEILVYQYMGMMNRPGTIAYCGHPDSVEYYRAYKKLFDRIRAGEK